MADQERIQKLVDEAIKKQQDETLAAASSVAQHMGQKLLKSKKRNLKNI